MSLITASPLPAPRFSTLVPNVSAMLAKVLPIATGYAREIAYASQATSSWATTHPTGLKTVLEARTVVRGTDRRTVPVLYVHGLCANPSTYDRIMPSAAQAGFDGHAVRYSSFAGSVQACGQTVADAAYALAAGYGTDQILVVAHSLGGLACRWAANHLGLGDVVDTFVTIAAPHRGAPKANHRAARVVPGLGPILAQLRPGSPFLTDLDAATPTMGARWVTIGSDQDVLVPAWSAALDHAALDVRNIEVAGAGHIGMTRSPDVVSLVVFELAAAEARLSAGRLVAATGPQV